MNSGDMSRTVRANMAVTQSRKKEIAKNLVLLTLEFTMSFISIKQTPRFVILWVKMC